MDIASQQLRFIYKATIISHYCTPLGASKLEQAPKQIELFGGVKP